MGFKPSFILLRTSLIFLAIPLPSSPNLRCEVWIPCVNSDCFNPARTERVARGL